LADALGSFPATNYYGILKSHKLRAKPRDPQFRGPFVEMFSTTRISYILKSKSIR
jgi:hypothetical protein